MTTTQELERIDEAGTEAWDRHDPEAFVDLFADEFVWQDAAMPEPIRTKDEARAFMRGWFEAFPDMKLRKLRRVVGDDTLAAELEFTGTNTGPLALGGMSLPSTGRAVVGRGTYFVTVKDGKVVQFNSYPDVAGLMAQLGLLPGG
jgi:steroid delta-isomerase-like uncharacterized protein